MTGPRRLDGGQLAPADLGERLEPPQRVAVRAPGSAGKWHLVGFDNTNCDRFIGGDWINKPLEQVEPGDLCRDCTYGGNRGKRYRR